MNWKEIYNKYKDTELMLEFGEYVGDNDNFPAEVDENYLCDDNIKDIWGYLIVFADIRHYLIDRESLADSFTETYHLSSTNDRVEQAMLWCADKFFEVA